MRRQLMTAWNWCILCPLCCGTKQSQRLIYQIQYRY